MSSYIKDIVRLLDSTDEMGNRALLWLFFKILAVSIVVISFAVPVIIALFIDPFMSIYSFTFLIMAILILVLMRSKSVGDKWYIGLLLACPTVLLFIGIMTFVLFF